MSGLPVNIELALARADHAERLEIAKENRERAERVAARRDADLLAAQQRSGPALSHEGVLGRYFGEQVEGDAGAAAGVLARQAAAEAVVERVEQARVQQFLQRGGDAALVLPQAGLRSERLAMQRRQRERLAARTPEQERIDQLEQQLTHLRAQLHARGW